MLFVRSRRLLAGYYGIGHSSAANYIAAAAASARSCCPR